MGYKPKVGAQMAAPNVIPDGRHHARSADHLHGGHADVAEEPAGGYGQGQ